MAIKTKSTCVVCGSEYDVCLSCKDQDRIKPWRSIADSVDCYKIFLALSQYSNGYISKDEAKRQLGQIQYNKNTLKEEVHAKVDEIMHTENERANSKKAKTPAVDVVSNNSNCE